MTRPQHISRRFLRPPEFRHRIRGPRPHDPVPRRFGEFPGRSVARLHHEVALRRGTAIHTLTKRLAAGFDTVAVEDLNVAGMVRSAKGTVEQPGRNVRAKAGLNRSVLDAALGEMRRQLEYKTGWYGSRLAVVDRWFPSSKTCSVCGAVKESLALSERVYVCSVCGARLDRDVNAARNIEAAGI